MLDLSQNFKTPSSNTTIVDMGYFQIDIWILTLYG